MSLSLVCDNGELVARPVAPRKAHPLLWRYQWPLVQAALYALIAGGGTVGYLALCHTLGWM